MHQVIEVFFDVETKTFFEEVGARDPSKLGVSLVSIYKRTVDSNLKEISGQMHSFFEKDFDKIWELFTDATRIIGYNSIKFDVPALSTYAPAYFAKLPHFDVAAEIKKVFGHMISLDKVCKGTLGRGKNDSGANAVTYHQKGDPESLRLLKIYCEMDVALTRDLYDYVLLHKQVKFTDRWNTPRTVDLDFSYPPEEQQSQIGLF